MPHVKIYGLSNWYICNKNIKFRLRSFANRQNDLQSILLPLLAKFFVMNRTILDSLEESNKKAK